MKCSVRYRNSYGNPKANAGRYTVTLARVKGRKLRVSFDYASPASGRGAGPAQGRVLGVWLSFPAKTAEALSHALRLALADTANKSIEFKINETAGA